MIILISIKSINIAPLNSCLLFSFIQDEIIYYNYTTLANNMKLNFVVSFSILYA